MLVEGNVTVAVLLEFLKRLMHNWTRNILLIVDGHPVHKSAAVSNFAAPTGVKLRLFHLPPYSPELNPDEQVWNNRKNHGVGKQPVTAPDQLQRMIISHLRKLQKLPGLVRSCLGTSETVYAAI